MANEEEYEILPHKEILDIKRELQKMKAGGSSDISKSGLDKSVNNLSSSIESMMDLFKNASEDIKLEKHDEKHCGRHLRGLP